ncbi:hypothetical protein B0H14DRAFT_2666853 [Mycena olivaceomarginata]|nr:hypothetical protein B0H14DRAFT_2666853 [Mycena olivaceomarginata]
MLRDLEADRVARLAAVEAKILDLKRSLPGLRAEKSLAQERLNSFKYPVLTLSNEITSEVLIHFLIPALPAAHWQRLADYSDTFREIAHTTRKLWRLLHRTSLGLSTQSSLCRPRSTARYRRRVVANLVLFWPSRSPSVSGPLEAVISPFQTWSVVALAGST